jgi:predicted metal-dependent hydrolase
VWISREGGPLYSRDNKLTQALCCATLQMLYVDRRRFDWLSENKLFKRNTLERWAASAFVPPCIDANAVDPAAARRKYFHDCVEILQSDTFGGLNPLTSAQVFRVLMGAGEDHAHEGIGFFAFFCMVWPLYRRYPDPLNIGAGVEPTNPTAYVTAKCLLTLDLLRRTCETRADLLARIAESLKKLDTLKDARLPFERTVAAWEIAAELERLRTLLARLAPIAIARRAFAECGKRAGEIADDLHLSPPRNLDGLADEFCRALAQLRQKTGGALQQADVVLEHIKSEIIEVLRPGRKMRRLRRKPFYMLFAHGRVRNSKAYREDLASSAGEALTLCKKAADALRKAATTDTPPAAPTLTWIAEQLNRLAEANQNIVKELNECVRLPSEWCRAVMEREIAFATAQNLSDFDAAELSSAIAVAVKGGLVKSPVQVRNAIEKMVLGAEVDGSWRLGHAYFTRDGIMGMRPSSADTVWTLVATLYMHPEIKVADRALFRFVQWLERTRKTVKVAGEEEAGWGMHRHRQGDRIHLATTAAAINALLDIRTLMEHRIWQLCKRRFTVLPRGKNLGDIDPVDMGLQHRHRLHRTLGEMARETRSPRTSADAAYSVVLHGPPGSSKTALTNALAADMWHLSISTPLRESKLVRITPADFTRMGEDRVDAEARLIFQLLTNIRGVTILFDEIDDLLLQRARESTERPRFLDLVVPAMLNRLQDLRDACPRQEICFLFGTNYIDSIEPALMRPGRVDAHLPVVYPDSASRRLMVARHLQDTLKSRQKDDPHRASIATWLDRWCQMIAAATAGWSWNDIRRSLKAVRVRQEVETALEDAIGMGKKKLPEAPAFGSAASNGRSRAVERLLQTENDLRNQLNLRALLITAPAYGPRLKRQPERSELRHEYIQHVLSMVSDFSDADSIVRRQKETFADFAGSSDRVREDFAKEMLHAISQHVAP